MGKTGTARREKLGARKKPLKEPAACPIVFFYVNGKEDVSVPVSKSRKSRK